MFGQKFFFLFLKGTKFFKVVFFATVVRILEEYFHIIAPNFLEKKKSTVQQNHVYVFVLIFCLFIVVIYHLPQE